MVSCQYAASSNQHVLMSSTQNRLNYIAIHQCERSKKKCVSPSRAASVHRIDIAMKWDETRSARIIDNHTATDILRRILIDLWSCVTCVNFCAITMRNECETRRHKSTDICIFTVLWMFCEKDISINAANDVDMLCFVNHMTLDGIYIGYWKLTFTT